MPFTPFHMGPGAAIKAVTGSYFSLSVFGFARIVIDSEPLVRILRGDAILHGVSHTYIGALFIGGFCLFAGRYACQGLFKAWNFMTSHKYLSWLNLQPDISWIAASSGAFFGTFSHVFLDSIMHADMQPLWPISPANFLLNFIPAGWLYLLCVFLGIVGLMVINVVGIWNKWAIEID